MKRLLLFFVLSLVFCLGIQSQRLQHSSAFLKAYEKTAVLMPFSVSALPDVAGDATKVSWGMDTAWDSADNVTRGTNYIGKDVMATGRISFQPSYLVDENGELSSTQKSYLQSRLNHIAISGVRNVILNCDHEALNKANYVGKPYEWYRVIKASVLYARSKGFNVTTVSPFNEPDYSSWGQGSMEDFKEICRYISEDKDLEGIRISAGNTLNCDQALSWYNYMKPYVTEGNTHQLAGSFDSFANFFRTVRADENHATADEMHNVAEALIGVHYGLQSGVWWGWDGIARGEFCRASYLGQEIGYAENRSAWSAGAVYRYDSRGMTNDIRAFFGTSERQAKTSEYEMFSTDHPVYYDGYGPVYNYSMTIPGGTGYQQGQTNAERMMQITYGEDVPPYELAEGSYVIMNRNSQRCIGYYNGARGNGISIVQNTYTGRQSNTHQRWLLRRVSDRVGGDFSYFFLKSERDSTQYIDLKNWSTAVGGTLIAYAGGGGALEQWCAEYAGDGDYYIRSRHSGLYLQVRAAKLTNNAAIEQAEFTGEANQRWRFMPTDAALEIKIPEAPTELKVQPASASVLLTWKANYEEDVVGYMVYRKALRSADAAVSLAKGDLSFDLEPWDCIARCVADTAFLDNLCAVGEEYLYKIKAIDRSGNLSASSDSIAVMCDDKPSCVLRYDFEKNVEDDTENMLDASIAGKASYSFVNYKTGENGLSLNGTTNYLLLPPSLGRMKQMSICTWVYAPTSSSSWQRLFDFGNDDKHYMFLTPNSGSDMRLVFRNGGDEQVISVPKMSYGWHHVAVTIPARGEGPVCLYVDGEVAASSSDITIRPSDIASVRNYIGRSQYASDPLFKGNIDDFRIYNYPLTAKEVLRLAGMVEVLKGDANGDGAVDVADITTIAAYILGSQSDSFIFDNADVNSDGVIDVADITSTAQIILSSPL